MEYKSKPIAAIVGPTLILMIISEMKLWNPTLYDEQIVPVIYLNGLLFFVAGLAIVRNHNLWSKDWRAVLTIIGYAILLIGVIRMFFPEFQKSRFENNDFILSFQFVLVALGVYITYKAYYPDRNLP